MRLIQNNLTSALVFVLATLLTAVAWITNPPARGAACACERPRPRIFDDLPGEYKISFVIDSSAVLYCKGASLKNQLNKAVVSLSAEQSFGITFFQGKAGFYYLVLVCLLGAYLFCRALVNAPFGAVLRGIRENEPKTQSLGYNTRGYKIAVVAIAYALGGLAGALYAPFAGFTNTELLFWLLSGQVLIMVIIGGAGTLVGPILGAVFFLLVQQQLSNFTDSWALFFGLIFIGFVLWAPEGLWGIATGWGGRKFPLPLGGEGNGEGVKRAPATSP